MARRLSRVLCAAGCASLLCGALSVVPAGAQTVPPLVGIGPAVSSCALLTDPSICIDAAVPPTSVIVGGIVALGPLTGAGHGNVDIDRDVDRSRQPGRVVIR